jgi:hypothetical protein
MAAPSVLDEALEALAEAPPSGLPLPALWKRLRARLVARGGAPAAGSDESAMLACLLRELGQHPGVRVMRAQGGGGDAAAAAAAGAGAGGLVVGLSSTRRRQTLGWDVLATVRLPPKYTTMLEHLVNA